MILWTLRIGLALVATGLALLSPLADFLPFDFWHRLGSVFLPGSITTEHLHYRFVPVEPGRIIEITLVGFGALLVTVSLCLRHRKRS